MAPLPVLGPQFVSAPLFFELPLRWIEGWCWRWCCERIRGSGGGQLRCQARGNQQPDTDQPGSELPGTAA